MAPGVGLNSSSSDTLYATCTGTSCSAPEVSGALALLLSAVPHLGTSLQQQLLIHGAVDLGAAGYDSTFGYGRLDVLNAYALLTPLVFPAAISASGVSPTQIDLSWQDYNQANATGYEVDRSPDGLTGWVTLGTTASGVTSFSDSSGLAEGTTYSYRVRAVNSGLGTASAYDSLQATTLLLAPTGVVAAAVSPAQINLSWQNNSSLPAGVEIQRSPDGLGGWVILATTAAADTTYSDTAGLSEGSTYFYRLRAVSPALGVGSQFAAASATTWLAPPTGFVAVLALGTPINLLWTNTSAHASGIELQRSLDGLSGWVTLTTAAASDTSYPDVPPAPDAVYYYRARATGLAPASAYTPVVHIFAGSYRILMLSIHN